MPLSECSGHGRVPCVAVMSGVSPLWRVSSYLISHISYLISHISYRGTHVRGHCHLPFAMFIVYGHVSGQCHWPCQWPVPLAMCHVPCLWAVAVSMAIGHWPLRHCHICCTHTHIPHVTYHIRIGIAIFFRDNRVRYVVLPSCSIGCSQLFNSLSFPSRFAELSLSIHHSLSFHSWFVGLKLVRDTRHATCITTMDDGECGMWSRASRLAFSIRGLGMVAWWQFRCTAYVIAMLHGPWACQLLEGRRAEEEGRGKWIGYPLPRLVGAGEVEWSGVDRLSTSPPGWGGGREEGGGSRWGVGYTLPRPPAPGWLANVLT